MATLFNLIGRALYPDNAVCIACGTLRVDAPAWGLCKRCADELVPLEPPLCPSCGQPGWLMECPDCAIRKPDALDGRSGVFAYEGTGGRLVRALKYGPVEASANALADGMAAAMPEGDFDSLVPVPLHGKRQRQRGFNQAELLCDALSKRTGLPVKQALSRERATRTQTQLSLEGRAANVKGAFVARLAVKGRMLLLVDDVLTTGATAVACAEALKAAGAKRVVLLAAAKAEK